MAKRLLFAASFIKEQDGRFMKKPLLLCIMDGFGINPADKGNAIKMAKTPNLDKLFLNYPHTQLSASGMAVGLPDGQMGNSEVGHTNIGAGRIVYQELTRITKSIQDGDFLKTKLLWVRWNMRRKTALHCILWAWYPTAVCTVTTPTFMPLPSLQNVRAWKRCSFTAF